MPKIEASNRRPNLRNVRAAVIFGNISPVIDETPTIIIIGADTKRASTAAVPNTKTPTILIA